MVFQNVIFVVIRNLGTFRMWVTKEAIVLLLYMAASAMTLNVFMQTRSFEEGSETFGLAAMLDGSAHRPYVYRQLLPIIANHAVELIPEQDRDSFIHYHLDKYHLKQQYFGRAKFQNKITEPWTPSYAIKYHIIYGANFFSLLGLAYLLRKLTKGETGRETGLSIAAPIMFLLLLPLTFIHGNFYYDFLELFFLAALLLTATANSFVWWILLLPLAVLNKESNILVPILYFPVIYSAHRGLKNNISVGLASVLAAAAYFFIKASYAANLGGETIWQLWKNLDFWLSPRSYLLWQDFYVPLIPFPRGINIFFVLLLTSLLSMTWKSLSMQNKGILLTAIIVNVPLWLLFCHNDEMRNLSFIFLPLYLVATKAVMTLFQPLVVINK